MKTMLLDVFRPTMTRFTNDTAFNETLQKYMRPAKSVTIIKTVSKITQADPMLNPVRMNEITKIVLKLIPKDVPVSFHAVRYCS